MEHLIVLIYALKYTNVQMVHVVPLPDMLDGMRFVQMVQYFLVLVELMVVMHTVMGVR